MQIQRKFVSFRIPAATYAAIETIKLRDGIPLSEQMRRALQLWLDAKKGMMPKKEKR